MNAHTVSQRQRSPLASAQEQQALAACGRRRASRLRTRLHATLTTRTRTVRAILLDISLTGAKLAVTEDFAPGCEAVLEWDRFDTFGEIVWWRAGMCGLDFFEPLPVPTLIATRNLDDAGHLPDDRELVRQTARNWVEGSVRL